MALDNTQEKILALNDKLNELSATLSLHCEYSDGMGNEPKTLDDMINKISSVEQSGYNRAREEVY